jgi:hypothetical protein
LGVLILGYVLLSGCTFGQEETQIPTLIPEEQLPTVIAQTSEAIALQTEAARPTLTKTPTPSLTKTTIPTIAGPTLTDSQTPTTTRTRPPTKTPTASRVPTQTQIPTITSTPTPNYTVSPLSLGEIPFATVQIVHPSSLSKVISPIELYTFVAPGGDERIRVELTGEDGRLLYRQVFLFTDTPAGARIHLNAKVAFEIIGVSETARLTVSVNDEYERLRSLASVDLVLLADGQADLNTTGDLLEEIFIQQPTIKSLVQGENVLVSGLARTGDDQPLLVELVTTDGRIIGTRLAGIAPLQEDGSHRLFAAEVPFSVSSPTWVRLRVSDRSGRLPGMKHVSSVEILLSP